MPRRSRTSLTDSAARTTRQVTRSLRTQAVTLGTMLGAFWLTFAVNFLLGGALTGFGIVPRTTDGLLGILFAPFLHGTLNHLIANTVPFAALGWMVMWRDARHFLPVTAFAMLGAGLMAWTLGAPGSVHIGASGVVFGYLGFLLLAGVYTRSVSSLVLSLVTAGLWGGLVLGIAPSQPGISWQAHLGGFLGGIVAARRYR
ncbi:MAG: rhomboid family intramembrane serine protease [Gemmatimonas sp.]|jgi:membrane associated rhomboid family serine protease|uniref:rhomboid family intramembrane serine protease n=1 Tax=Gemmatimonas sp. TaxID=1962908 RepID=UPI0022BDE246|nr:rhomboid family intramembrane serine protease [Gemmatimonas sp.]MCA2982509.1 rhomboid family intramembrane serine protease [Gemmatimonas sp.]MCA2987969.1 rhomboid family intramembrane serine protease [Gemmatimonas sp.]MCA2994715.1 rhomboid family intramembrane serine protease [Gemmatimonas sp.]MCE2952707.1 rhomboid family intramembrane serine protease [Gemmatimonas sp.]MCZ8010863.1 rhomboid family intramembrane serine protease [Gemmatimonas sp.]